MLVICFASKSAVTSLNKEIEEPNENVGLQNAIIKFLKVLDGLNSKMEVRENRFHELEARSIEFMQSRQQGENRLNLE